MLTQTKIRILYFSGANKDERTGAALEELTVFDLMPDEIVDMSGLRLNYINE